jgi:hypothetical protein
MIQSADAGGKYARHQLEAASSPTKRRSLGMGNHAEAATPPTARRRRVVGVCGQLVLRLGGAGSPSLHVGPERPARRCMGRPGSGLRAGVLEELHVGARLEGPTTTAMVA